MKTIKKILLTTISFLYINSNLSAQQKETIAILDLDAINTFYKSKEISRLLRSEATKLDKYSVMDVYEMKETFKAKKFNDSSCFSKSCAIAAGELLKVDYATVGSIERFGPKIIITINLIKVSDESIKEQVVHEFISKEDEIQRMLRISLQELFGTELESQLSKELSYIELPVSNPNNYVNLNGPRMGLAFIQGNTAKILTSSKDVGGFEMLGSKDLALTTSMGYQWEQRYIATSNFQALVEVVALASGMEIGRFNPSFTFLNGLRFSKSNWEFGFGPTLKFKTLAYGYYDNNGVWHLENDWKNPNERNPFKIVRELDSRGKTEADIGMVIAFGKTFQSGRLNIPVNLYYSPKRNSNTIGLSIGFNIQKAN